MRSIPSHRGFALVELIVATAILAILTTLAIPLFRVSVKREKERELRHALWEMRDAQQPAQGPSQSEVVRKFLQDYIGSATQEKESTRYSAAFVDLRDHGAQEVIVYLSSDGWCGTGGCTLLILAPEGTSYRLVTRIPAVRLPVRVLTTKTNGWHDFTVSAGQPLHEAKLPFDGKTYPRNASMPPARPLSRKVAGKIVMPETVEDKPLY